MTVVSCYVNVTIQSTVHIFDIFITWHVTRLSIGDATPKFLGGPNPSLHLISSPLPVTLSFPLFPFPLLSLLPLINRPFKYSYGV